jgi:hypothetical protein
VPALALALALEPAEALEAAPAPAAVAAPDAALASEPVAAAAPVPAALALSPVEAAALAAPDAAAELSPLPAVLALVSALELELESALEEPSATVATLEADAAELALALALEAPDEPSALSNMSQKDWSKSHADATCIVANMGTPIANATANAAAVLLNFCFDRIIICVLLVMLIILSNSYC